MDIIVTADTDHPHLLLATLDRPARSNAMSEAMVRSLLDLLAGLEPDGCAGLILTGAGKGFCAGSDLAALAAMTAEERSAFEKDCGVLARRLASFPIPTVAAVHGFAIGGGLTLAAACDIVVTHPAAKWSLPEVPIGLFPAWGLQHVALRTGRPVARRLSWGLETLDGAGAAAVGLADHMADDPLSEALAIGRRLASLPRTQAAAVKDYFSLHRTGDDADSCANRHFAAATATPEALASFSRYGSR